MAMGWLFDLWKYGFTDEQRTRSRAAERYAQALDEYERELDGLSAQKARAAAERVLAAPRFIRVVRWPMPQAPRGRLAPLLREFFGGVQRIEAPHGESYVDITELAPLAWASGYLCLGRVDEHTHIAVRPGDEGVYVMADDVPAEEALDTVLPTVYHYVLWLEHSEGLLAEPDPPST
jgi:hypothetical protein